MAVVAAVSLSMPFDSPAQPSPKPSLPWRARSTNPLSLSQTLKHNTRHRHTHTQTHNVKVSNGSVGVDGWVGGFSSTTPTLLFSSLLFGGGGLLPPTSTHTASSSSSSSPPPPPYPHRYAPAHTQSQKDRSAHAGNRTRVASVAGTHHTTRPRVHHIN